MPERTFAVARKPRDEHEDHSRQHANTPVFLPGDRVVFAESPSAPGIPIVYRTADERSANPDRLNLDRRRLTVCPVLEGEDQLRLLNYQHNLISRIQHLNGLKRLIFLDLYDNQIDEISGLGSLRSLRVLMLGKNKIQKIENLDNLAKLDVLDLHGNQIEKIENLQHLIELRVLNLAGNKLKHVNNLCGMDALTELNLRRNNITTAVDVDNLASLQRLFLSFNEISSFDDISCLGESASLSEISLDGNPLASDPNYKQIVLRQMQQLRQLDMKRISEDERRVAAVMARKEEEKKREHSKINAMKERRRQAINNARKQWEVMQGSVIAKTNKLVRSAMPELYANHVANVPAAPAVAATPLESEDESPGSISSTSRLSRPASAQSDRELVKHTNSSRVASQNSITATPPEKMMTPTPNKFNKPLFMNGGGGEMGNLDHLSELEGDTLSLYGNGAMDAFDKNWGIQAAGAVTTICFKFIDFSIIAKHLHKIRVRFPNVHTLIFSATNIWCLQQLNALAAVRRLDHIIIDSEGNDVTKFSLWRTYLIFRLAHFSLKKINDTEVSASDIVNAEKFFGTIAHLTSTDLPQSRLQSLLSDSKRKQMFGDEKRKPGSTEQIKISDRGSESVGRAGLVYTVQQTTSSRYSKDQKGRKDFVKNYIHQVTHEAIQTEQKQSILQRLWPHILRDMVHAAVTELMDIDKYRKKCMEELEKG